MHFVQGLASGLVNKVIRSTRVSRVRTIDGEERRDRRIYSGKSMGEIAEIGRDGGPLPECAVNVATFLLPPRFCFCLCCLLFVPFWFTLYLRLPLDLYCSFRVQRWAFPAERKFRFDFIFLNIKVIIDPSTAANFETRKESSCEPLGRSAFFWKRVSIIEKLNLSALKPYYLFLWTELL